MKDSEAAFIYSMVMAEVYIERTDAKAETPILWPPDVKN